jgi:hypothetical protein
MYNQLPRIDPMRSLDGGIHREPEGERAVMRRLHREHGAAERARTAEQDPGPARSGLLFSPPAAAAMLALLGMRRAH